ncbi:MAG: MBL fold metallo-hydrolase [Bacillaceae bacterium]
MQVETLQIGAYQVTWLNGGTTNLDGGAMFGVVPKPLWTRKYDCNEKNQILMRNDPILIQGYGKNYLIDSGIGKGKMTDKQKRNFGVTEETNVEQSLHQLGLTIEDIDVICMTHLHFDHASGLTTKENEDYVPYYRNATIYTSQIEWDEMRNPNIRSRNTYWKENWEPIVDQVETFQQELQVAPGLRMIHTGGHSDGHCIIVLESEGETLLHLADIMPTHAHQNVLWVMAYDDYPMTSVFEKQKWIQFGLEKDAWFTFYHDAYVRCIKWNEDGTVKDEIRKEE